VSIGRPAPRESEVLEDHCDVVEDVGCVVLEKENEGNGEEESKKDSDYGSELNEQLLIE
jgi:hypothetical protein